MNRFMRLLLLVVIALQITSFASAEVEAECASPGECANPDMAAPKEDPNCPSREHVIKCAGKTLDANKNGKLDRDELQGAIDLLPWYSRGKILAWIETRCALETFGSLLFSLNVRYSQNPWFGRQDDGQM